MGILSGEESAIRATDAAEGELALGTGNGKSCPRGHLPSLWAVRHKAELQQPNSKFQAKQATETPNEVLITESFRLGKTSDIEPNH